METRNYCQLEGILVSGGILKLFEYTMVALNQIYRVQYPKKAEESKTNRGFEFAPNDLYVDPIPLISKSLILPDCHFTTPCILLPAKKCVGLVAMTSGWTRFWENAPKVDLKFEMDWVS